MKQNHRFLQTAAEVIDVLGGLRGVSDLTGSQYKAVANWKMFNAFPPRTYLIMQAALRRRRRSAPAALWGMIAIETKQLEAAQ